MNEKVVAGLVIKLLEELAKSTENKIDDKVVTIVKLCFD